MRVLAATCTILALMLVAIPSGAQQRHQVLPNFTLAERELMIRALQAHQPGNAITMTIANVQKNQIGHIDLVVINGALLAYGSSLHDVDAIHLATDRVQPALKGQP